MQREMTEHRPSQSLKVVCPGFGRTGTTSLAQALNILEIRAQEVQGHWNLIRSEDGQLTFNPDTRELVDYDAYVDSPVPLIYKDLLKMFPDAKVILTTRPRGAWLSSIHAMHESRRIWWERNHQDHPEAWELRRLFETYNRQVFGSPWFDEDVYAESFERHYTEVRQYCFSRTAFLEIDITSGAGWDSICNLLGKEKPNIMFPCRNRSRRISQN